MTLRERATAAYRDKQAAEQRERDAETIRVRARYQQQTASNAMKLAAFLDRLEVHPDAGALIREESASQPAYRSAGDAIRHTASASVEGMVISWTTYGYANGQAGADNVTVKIDRPCPKCNTGRIQSTYLEERDTATALVQIGAYLAQPNALCTACIRAMNAAGSSAHDDDELGF